MTAKRKPPQTKPTMDAVAAAAGVSTSTVSRCLNQPELALVVNTTHQASQLNDLRRYFTGGV